MNKMLYKILLIKDQGIYYLNYEVVLFFFNKQMFVYLIEIFNIDQIVLVYIFIIYKKDM